MKAIKSHLLFNARQRSGILFLILIIVALQLSYFFVDFSSEENQIALKRELYWQQKADSIKNIKEVKKTVIYSFNPNYITDFKGYQLGMSVEEIDRLLAFRAQGKFVNSAHEFQLVTKVHDTLLHKISPYFKFPDWVSKRNNTQTTSNKTAAFVEIQDINKATEADLIKVHGIGEVLAKRIIQYRNKLGGFTLNQQIYEVWNLEKQTADKVLEQFVVKEKPFIKKINVNTASFKEVLAIVYIDYDLCKKIFDYKREIAEYQSVEEFKKIDGFPVDKFDRIILYLDVK
ncbi:MAG: helix-hairpin-helix domain-containing protein [Bacteroidetes bacterium]|nr:helix-hairpin-helix domain-containing protein [Bacteroidota bacterium]